MKRMLVLSILTGIIIALSMPLTYLFLSVKDEKEMAISSSRDMANLFREGVKNTPLLWRYNALKYSFYHHEQLGEVRVFDKHGALIQKRTFAKPGLFMIRGSWPITYNNETYGYVEASHDATSIFTSTGILFIAFSCLGLAVGLLLYRFPTRMVVRAENRTLQAYRELNYIAFSLGEGICVTDREGVITFVNPAAEKILGRSRDELAGQDFHEAVFGCSTRHNQPSPVLKTVSTGEPQRIYEDVFINREGRELPVSYVITPIREERGITGCVTVFQDISERRLLQQEVARLDRMHIIGEMAAGIGHEIRNPMTTVRGFLQILAERKEMASYRNFYKIMIEELDRANSIITEYLNLAKNKHVDLELQDLNAVIRTLFPLIQADAMMSDKKVSLVLGDIPELAMDEKEIRQMIINLARNGLEAMDPGGRLVISTYTEPGNLVAVSVRDEGKGIDNRLMERIGTPFFTTKDQGTGLGLAICYSIAARHNAKIKILTGPDGSNFLVKFNVLKNHAALKRNETNSAVS